MITKNMVEEITAGYHWKIDDCDLLLAELGNRITRARNNGDTTEDMRGERAVLLARRQAYVQAQVDFDSLLDYV